MYDLVPRDPDYDLVEYPKGSNPLAAFTRDLLSAIPSALAKPILEYQYTKEKSKLLKIAIEVRRQERADILETMRVLAAHKQLTPELYQMLMVAYGLPPTA